MISSACVFGFPYIKALLSFFQKQIDRLDFSFFIFHLLASIVKLADEFSVFGLRLQDIFFEAGNFDVQQGPLLAEVGLDLFDLIRPFLHLRDGLGY
jgi:hypothetical protein